MKTNERNYTLCSVETMDTQLIIYIFLAFLFLNSVVAQPLPRLSSQTEWRALLDLRASLGIKAKYWHRKANPCLNWTGIDCKNGHVTGINLSGLRRTRRGKLNPRFAIDSLPNIPFLSTFNSSGFLLNGSIPEWLGQRLSNLEVLDLRSSSIHGSIPSSLGSLSRLSSLYLSNNSIAGNMPTTLGGLHSLSVLHLSQNLLTGQIPSEISALGNLSTLDLSSNYLSGMIPLDFGSLSSLESLNLSYNSLSSPIPAQLGNLSQLLELDLAFNSLFGSLPNELGGLRNLRKMLIGNNELDGSLVDVLFQKLTRLEDLVLCRNHFNGVFPGALWSMSHLKYLDISGNNLTGDSLNLTGSSNVSGAVFNFSNNLFFGSLNLGSRKLHIFDVSSNYFEGSAPNDTGINVSNNCFSGVKGQRNPEACRKFYLERGLSFGNDTHPQPPSKQPSKSRNRLTYFMVGVFGGFGFIIVVTTVAILLLKACHIRTTNHQREKKNIRPDLEQGIEPTPNVIVNLSSLGQPFTNEQMVAATQNFSIANLIKHGHSGDLFRGTLEGECDVVVKRFDLRSNIKKESFVSELDLFGKVSHPRLVPLLGHCLEDEHEKFLVYKYMKNGDLSNALHGSTNAAEEEMQSLDWITRLKIAIGAADALSYLHHECTPPIVHRDIQASSILLDDKYEVRLGSFSEVCTTGTNNHHNMIGRLIRTPKTSAKRPSGSSSTSCSYDVYCFGKVLLELVTGMLGLSRLNETDAKQWLESNLPFISMHEKDLLIKILDQSLIIDDDLLEEVWAVAIVAKSCLNPKASRRPSMRHVLKALENPFKVVREESSSSGKLKATSPRQSWTAAIFGSWHRSSSDGSNTSGQTSREIVGGLRGSSRGSGPANDYSSSQKRSANDYSSSHKRSSSDVHPEPVEMQDVESRE
ncbi:Serine/threonine protein kinase [Handroanthus impetiginosus]|uniref:Serine/threonine protein kinase n=1 Tax=Handroanthus impetiginosus TaxID=429701 RepID=A0A2G9H6D8_9LAMI|nr:Serine/threonine protein kinase [Handroanthus impetiginosus]